jgi:polysaccharide biosynthesis protein PslH
MRLLWVATKPPWPPADGGRLLQLETLRALAAEGHELTLVAACSAGGAALREAAETLRPLCRPHLVPARRAGWPLALARSLGRGLPLSVARHGHRAVEAAVAGHLEAGGFDVLHAEQLQTLPSCLPALARRVPIVLRCQNVESSLWQALAGTRRLAGPLLRVEAARLARFEGHALRQAAAAVALTERDARCLQALALDAPRVHCVPAPFPARLPPAHAALDGKPAVVVLGDPTWLPNREGARWFVREVWPLLRARLPGAVLHLYGTSRPRPLSAGLVEHGPLPDSREAFAPGSILAVPLAIASGVRMKILEAWARGVPVVASPEAAAGLGARPGREIEVAAGAEAFAEALAALHHEPERASAQVAAARERLQRVHDPRLAARRLAAIYSAASGGKGGGAAS